MKAVSLSEVKKELSMIPTEVLVSLCVRLAKYKKENKELLSYLLFESDNDDLYAEQVKQELEACFRELDSRYSVQNKKKLSKAIRLMDKHIKFVGSKRFEAQMRIFFCSQIKKLAPSFRRHSVIQGIYQRQMDKLNKAIAALHEDLQYDFKEEIKSLGL